MEEVIKNSAELRKEQVALVAPLDWGLGHATRCIPLLKQLQKQDLMMIIIEGRQKGILQQEIPGIDFRGFTGLLSPLWPLGMENRAPSSFQIPKILMEINRKRGG